MKLLILKADHLGDFALSLPVFWELKQYLQESGQMKILAHPMNTEWGEILPWLPKIEALKHPRYDWGEALVPFYFQLIQRQRQLRSENFDFGVNLSGSKTDRWGGALLALAEAKALPAQRRPSNQAVQLLHETRRIAEVFPSEWSITGTALPQQFMPKEWRWHSGQTILLAPAVRTSAKSWPVELWQRLIRLLPRDSTRVLIPGDDSGNILRAWVPPGQAIASRSIRKSLALLRESAVVVAPDTAMGHLAWLVGTPIVQLFSGTASPDRWRSLSEGILLHQPPKCAPCKQVICFRSTHECMLNIEVEQVSSAIQRYL